MKSKELQRKLGVTQYRLQRWVAMGLLSNQEYLPGSGASRTYTNRNMYEGMLIKALLGVGLPVLDICELAKHASGRGLDKEKRLVVVFDRKILTFMDDKTLCAAIKVGAWDTMDIVRWRL